MHGMRMYDHSDVGHFVHTVLIGLKHALSTSAVQNLGLRGPQMALACWATNKACWMVLVLKKHTAVLLAVDSSSSSSTFARLEQCTTDD